MQHYLVLSYSVVVLSDVVEDKEQWMELVIASVAESTG